MRNSNEITIKVSSFIDEVAVSKGYDSSSSISSYINSSVELWRLEAASFIEWRDSVWRVVFDYISSTELTQSSYSDVFALIPKINWPSDD